MSPVTATRRRLIRKLIGEQKITSQAVLVELLEAAGHSVTQATVSRDLDAIGAAKVRDEAGTDYYAITANSKPMSSISLMTVTGSRRRRFSGVSGSM